MTPSEFVHLLESHQKIIFKICRAYTNTDEDLKDYIQEVTLQLWRSVGSFNGQAKISTWIYKVTLNVCLTEIKKSNRNPDLISWDQGFDLSDASDSSEQENLNQLYAAIRKLSKADRAIILLYLEEKSYKEMSEILGIGTSHIGVKIMRIKNTLKTMVNGK